jgi:hypothetical protein
MGMSMAARVFMPLSACDVSYVGLYVYTCFQCFVRTFICALYLRMYVYGCVDILPPVSRVLWSSSPVGMRTKSPGLGALASWAKHSVGKIGEDVVRRLSGGSAAVPQIPASPVEISIDAPAGSGCDCVAGR